MASGAEIAAGAGSVAQAVPGAIGRGKSQYNAQDISHSPMYDPFAYQWGNYGAENYAQGREQQARAIDQRAAPQANYMQADMDRQRALQARASQASIMGQLLARANGQTPSIAQMQADRQIQQASAQQAALSASARGRGALANAATTAANNTANAHGAISNTAQINAANERLQAEQAAFGAASGMRGQDYQSQGQAAQQAQYQAGLQMANRQTNDQRAIQTQQMGHQALGAEQQGRVQQQGIAAQSHANAQQQNAQTERQNANNKGIIDTVVDFFDSDMRAKEPLMLTSDFSSKLQLAPEPGQAPTGSGLWGGALQRTPLPSWMGGGGMTSSTWGGGGTNPMSGPGPASFDRLQSNLDDVGTSMDVTGSLARHSKVATQYQSDPTGGMTGGAFGTSGMIVSDDRAKLKEAFEEGAKYADAAHAGVAIKAPEYARGRNPTLGPEPTKQTEEAEAVTRARTAAAMAAQPKPVPAMPAQPLPIQRAIQAVPPMPVITSDFSAKTPIMSGLTRDAFGNGVDGDPNAPQFRFVPGQGWINDAAPQRPDLQAAIAQEADLGEPGHHADDAYWQKKVADNDRKLAQQAEWAQDDEPLADDGKRMAPGTKDFENTKPKPEDEAAGTKPWWMIAGDIGRGLTEAQFGGVKSDARAKEAIDLDDPGPMTGKNVRRQTTRGILGKDGKVDWVPPEVYGHDPSGKTGGRRLAHEDSIDLDEETFDADEHVESKFPKPYNEDDYRTRRDTPADQARVKRAYEDKAGRDADEMMASMRASLGRGATPNVQVSGDPPDLREAARLRDEDALRPSNSPLARANRTMKGVPYRYKPEHTPPEQAPGEVNWGFMAQNLKKEAPTATAVKEDANGMQRVDALKLLRLLGASVADLQEQQDETRLALAKGGRR